MNISKINNINFGIKFSDKAENLFQKSQAVPDIMILPTFNRNLNYL